MGVDRAIDITAKQRKIVTDLLERHLPNTTAWVYGSRAKWASRPQSDLDLVVFATPEQNGRVSDLREALEESSLPFRVDLFVWDTVPKQFRKHIKRDHVVLAATKNDAVCAWPRVALRDMIDLRLSSVDKKTNPTEHAVRLCNYMDVYRNSFIHGGLDFMKATATEQEIANCSLFSGDVVITKDSEKHDDIGVPALVREDIPRLVCGYHLAILRPISIDGAYLFYALSTNEVQQQFHSYANGVTRFGLRKADIGLVETPLPPPPEQRAIAHILGTLDDKIELNRRMNKTLEAMARALFKSWFVDFDPVRAKMAGRDTGLPKHLADFFPDRLVESELGEIPEGWKIGTVSQLAERIQNGGTPKRSEPTYWERGEIPWLISSEVRQSFVLGTQNFISEKGLEKSSAKMVPARSILVALYGATAGQVSMNYRPLSTNQAVTAVIPSMGNRYFCLVGLKLEVSALENRAVGSAQQNISKKVVEETIVLLPQIELRSAYDVLVESLFDRIFYSLHETQTLSDLRAALLPKLISGALRVEHTSNQ